MGYFRDLHTNPDGSCITCNTQQLAYQDYRGCLCSIIDDVGADEMNRIIKLLDVLNTCDCDPNDGQAKHYRCSATQGLTPSGVIALIQEEN